MARLAVIAFFIASAAANSSPCEGPGEHRPTVNRQDRSAPTDAGAPPRVKPRTEQKREIATYAQVVRRSALEGAEWLRRSQMPNGLFRYGWLPALDRPLPGDNALRQAGAAAALARAAILFEKDDFRKSAVVAIKALLLQATELHPQRPDQRRSALSPTDANPVGFSALLLLAISELEDPEPALAEQAEQIARFVVSRQRSDGSINVSISFRDDGEDSPTAAAYYPGEAFYALLRSSRRNAGAWKIGAMRKGLPYYRNLWRNNPAEAFVPWMTSACAEAFFATGEPAFADFALELADWSLSLQHLDAKAAARGWCGGFGSFQGGQFLETEPGSTTASFAEALVYGYRVASVRGNVDRAEAYRQALDRAALFLLATQYTPERCAHFTEPCQRRLNGGFWASASDGSLRIDQNQHAVNALTHYLVFVIEQKRPDGKHLRPPGPQAN